MAPSDADAAAATVTLFDALYTDWYCGLAASVLFIYDAFVTFDREVACFWAAERKGGASVLFFANRWISMTLYSLLLVQFASFPSDKLSSRGAVRGILQSTRLSLSDVLFNDGTIYFIVLFALNILHLVLTLTALAVSGGDGASYVTIFTTPLTAILISRFLLDLQETNQAVVRVDPDDPLHTSRDPYDTPSFISSLGAFVHPDDSARSDDEFEMYDVSRPVGEEEDGAGVSKVQQAAAPASSSSA
ncbi:hypothetical protein K466DRAFT_660053 [Polyporus arcularius HHB13444]|uniref:DUF6533 domain-containing protein n=1 Tax=Polyporus arcularius HHB13444 TaxID=1314778 RepID=A0A5C3PSU2_9APHY|nr:hypothetical protein K466DRAFT_660053 [Polyporus arcularius HHB13444]